MPVQVVVYAFDTVMIRLGFSHLNKRSFYDFHSFQRYIKLHPSDAWLKPAAYMMQFLSPNNLSNIHLEHFETFSFSDRYSNDSLLGSLKSGHIVTTVLNLAITEERRRHFDFATPHRSNEYCFFMRKHEKFAERSWMDACPIPLQHCALMALIWIALECLNFFYFHSSRNRFVAKFIFLLQIFYEAVALQFYSAGLKASVIDVDTEYLFETVDELTNLLKEDKLYMIAYDTGIAEFDLLNHTKLPEYVEFRDAIFGLTSTRILDSYASVCLMLNSDERAVYFSTLSSVINLCCHYLENLEFVCPQNRFTLLEAFGFTKGSSFLERINFAVPFIVAEDIHVTDYGLRGLYDEGSSKTSLATWLPNLKGNVRASSLESVALAIGLLIGGFLFSFMAVAVELLLHRNKQALNIHIQRTEMEPWAVRIVGCFYNC